MTASRSWAPESARYSVSKRTSTSSGNCPRRYSVNSASCSLTLTLVAPLPIVVDFEFGDAVADAFLQLRTNPTHPHAQRIQRNPLLLGEALAVGDLRSLVVAIIIEQQARLGARQRLQAAARARHAPL